MAFVLGVLLFVVVLGILDSRLIPRPQAREPRAAAMIAGHFGLAAGVKGRERQIPLWALMLATVWLDIVFAPLLAAGVESIDTVPGTSGGYGKAIIHADWTHSLVGALALATLFGLVAARPWGRRAGIILGVVVFSHWLLDLVVHRGDMPILPGNAGDLPDLGFGLWKTPAVSILVELALVVAGAWLYWRAAVQTSTADPRRANLLGLLVLGAGLITLAVDALVA
jgi:membrane-bound metal-dependent hydrolase YbcI (DUF457 family)